MPQPGFQRENLMQLKITRWAKSKGLLKKIEVLTFVDGNTSIDWMIKAGAKVMNLLTKGSMNHLTHQLKKSPAQHFAEIAAVISKAKKKGIDCNVYLEDWSNGMRNSLSMFLNTWIFFLHNLSSASCFLILWEF